MDAKQLASDKNIKKPPLRIQLKQAGMQVSVERFYLYSVICGVVLTVLAYFSARRF